MPEIEPTSNPACRDCPHLAAEPQQCALRSVAIADPAATTCASHPAHGPLRRPFAIGPVVGTAGGAAEIIAQAPDDRPTRERLLDLIAAVEVRGTAPLAPRDAMVVWQLRELGEPRAFPHLDRIDAAMTINRARGSAAGTPTGSLLQAIGRAATIAMPELAAQPPRRDHDFLLQFSLAGRLVLLSAIAVGVASFGGLLLLEVGIASWLPTDRVVLHLGAAALLGALLAGLWILFGRLVLARCGVPFWRQEPAGRATTNGTPPDAG